MPGLTCLWAHLIQQFDHALPLHGGPGLDGRAASDLAVLLLDLRRAALCYEWPQCAVEGREITTLTWKVSREVNKKDLLHLVI